MTLADGASLFFDLGWKAGVTALVLICISVIGRRLGPFMASILMAMPMNAGPGYFFLALTEEPAFLAHGALISFIGGGAVYLYIALYVQTAVRLGGLVLPLILGVSGWAAGAAILELDMFEVNVISALVFVVVCVVLTRPFVMKLDAFSAPTGGDRSWRLTVLRAAIGGGFVALAAVASLHLGPTFAGFVFAFPTTILATTWMLTRSFDARFAAATIQSARVTLLNYLAFCLVLYLAALQLSSSIQAWLLAVVAAILSALVLAVIANRKRAAARASGEATATNEPV